MTKISGYAALATAQADDVLPVVDVHDTSMAATGTTKKITVGALTAQTVSGFTAFGTGGMLNGLNSTSGANTVGIAGQTFYAALWVPFNVTLTGLMFTTGTVGATDNWIGALWAAAGGVPLASSSLAGIVAPAANTKKAKAHPRRQLALGSAVACCSAEALAASLRLTGWPVSDAHVLALYWHTARDEHSGASILATLEAASEFGLAGMRPIWFGEIEGPPAVLSLPDLPSAALRPGRGVTSTLLGLRLPAPHAVLDTGSEWISWGQPWAMSEFPDVVLEEAWEVTWPDTR